MDTSKKMKVSHNQGLETKIEAERHFAIMPPALTPDLWGRLVKRFDAGLWSRRWGRCWNGGEYAFRKLIIFFDCRIVYARYATPRNTLDDQ